ncbi:MAG: dihydrodipicolinate synthase family protein [Betaproteobacteria bacterium]
MTERLRGVLAPVLTPFDDNGEPDAARFVSHCRWLIANGASLAVFGTNSEAASLAVDERIALTDALLAAGVPPARLMPGTGACALRDAVTLTSHAVRSGAAGVLMLPPFYFKGVSDDGLFAYYANVIERVGDSRLAVYLYHIPQVTQVPITLALIERLLRRYPGVIAGAKDSSGDWANATAMIDAFAADGFAVFPASESLLSRALPVGGAGCISATVNMNPAGIRALYDGWNTPEGPSLQRKADAIRAIFQSPSMIPAMKRVVAEFAQDPAWRNVRPPLIPLDDVAAGALLARLRDVEFRMAGYPAN